MQKVKSSIKSKDYTIKIEEMQNNKYKINDDEIIHAPNIETAKLRYEKKHKKDKDEKTSKL